MTPEQRIKNAEKMRRFRASLAGKAYRKSEKYKTYRRDLKRKIRSTPEGNLKSQRYSLKSSLKTNYGLTLGDWDQMLIAQSGRCALCNIPMGVTLKDPTVDHCHITGKVRGLLCNNCNLGIGHFRESTSILQQAINYLQSHSS